MYRLQWYTNRSKHMTLFITYTILAWLAIASLTKVLHFSIQPGQWLDSWQKVLHKIDLSKYSSLSKPLGYCEMCFAHLLAFIGFIVYTAFVSSLNAWVLNWWQSIIWYMVFVPISTILNVYFIKKLLA